MPRPTPVHLILTLILTGLLLASSSPGVSALTAGIRWPDLDRSLSAYASESNFLVAEFAGNGCTTIHGRNADEPLAIASVFKLYVLGELARQVQLGQAGWNDRVRVTDDLRSMPSGDFAWVRTGTTATTRELAEAMIWQSDNTATDHLIDYLGRENVQAAFAAFGHQDPSLNAPLLLTRELFGIKMSQSDVWMARYMAASDDEQLAMLEATIDPMRINPDGGWGNWSGPTAIDGIEWFASANDLCRAMSSLWSMGAQPGLDPIREILIGNRSGVTDTATWPRAGYKGGYEAGVVNLSWVLERADGRVFFVTTGYNQDHGIIPQTAGRDELVHVFACLGVTSGPASCAPA